MTGIVILNYRHADEVIALVRSIENYLSIDSIVVVDNASGEEDTTKLMRLQGDRIRILYETGNGGYAKGNNAGLRFLAREIGCDILFVANPDVEFSDETAARIAGALKANPGYGVLAPQLLTWDKKAIPMRCMHRTTYGEALLNGISVTLVQKRYLRYFPLDTHAILEQCAVGGCFFAITREAAEKIGYLDENTFLYHEEEILGMRLQAAGFRLGVLGDCLCVHHHMYHQESRTDKMRALKICQASEIYMWKTYGGIGRIRLGFLWIVQRITRPMHYFVCLCRAIDAGFRKRGCKE